MNWSNYYRGDILLIDWLIRILRFLQVRLTNWSTGARSRTCIACDFAVCWRSTCCQNQREGTTVSTWSSNRITQGFTRPSSWSPSSSRRGSFRRNGPAKSPDLSPVENAWGIVECALKNCGWKKRRTSGRPCKNCGRNWSLCSFVLGFSALFPLILNAYWKLRAPWSRICPVYSLIVLFSPFECFPVKVLLK